MNHKQTFRQESEGGYLWSPKREKNARSQYYDNMREVSPGDLIVSFARAQISLIGVASDYAITAPKPSEFGKAGIKWNAVGWLLPVEWHELTIPITPKQMLKEIKELLPAKYSPLNPKTGNGNQKAYLTEISPELFFKLASAAKTNPEDLPPPSSEVSKFVELQEQTAVNNILTDKNLSDTEKQRLIMARKGHGHFRSKLLEIEPACRVTGISSRNLLIASHIKPWRSCDTGNERLDGYNGLLLAPHIDYLFDRGFISFLDDGQLIVSAKLSKEDASKLGLSRVADAKVVGFHSKQKKYLSYHREEIFID